MLSPGQIAKVLKPLALLDVRDQIAKHDVHITFNTLNKLRRGDTAVQYKSMVIASDYLEGAYD